ncbi:hypothetical protein [Aegicerativicinus sediminis]|uniref:hypothetical protein n=1 Tax=Aegicerativicinus sediminis TaxID=2893202 RepID=UPI001E5B8A90|nr:hypothetical protein [Aegicerativicinus sediminis]
MIKFFRKIRQKLISENKFSKYLFYALGEIILVVIGILIALQVNNLNDKRNIEANTKNNLITLRAELISNKEKLKFNIDVVNAQIRNSLNLIDSLNKNMDLDDKDLFLLNKIGKLGPLRLKSLTTTSLSDFINSGYYSAFLTGEIKNNLLVYNSEIQNVNVTLDRFEEYWKEIELPYLTNHFSILDMYTQSLSNPSEQANRLTDNTILKSNKKYFTNDLEAFFNNREFASMYTARFAELRAVFYAMDSLISSIDNLIKSINTIL